MQDLYHQQYFQTLEAFFLGGLGVSGHFGVQRVLALALGSRYLND